MPKNLDFFNLSNVLKSFSDKEILSPRRLVKKFSSAKKKGVKLMSLVKNKYDKTFASSSEISNDEETELEGQKLKLPLQRPKSCLCSESEVQPKWRARISEIGSIARNSLTRSREPSAIPLSDTREISFHSETRSSLDKPENLAAIVGESFYTNDPQLRSRRSSSFAKNNGILLGVNQMESAMSSQTPERQQSLQTSRKSLIKSPRSSFPLAMEEIKSIEKLQSKRSSSLAKNDRTSLKINQLEDEMKMQTPERQQSLQTSRQSSIKSPRTSLPIEMKPMTPTEELQSRRSSSLAKNNRISLEINQLEDKMKPQTPERQSLQTSRKLSIKSPRTSSPLAIEQIKAIEELQSRRSSSISKNDRISLEINQLEDKMKPQTPERQQSLQTSRKSSIKSPRTSSLLAIEQMKAIEELQSRRSSSLAKNDRTSLGINQLEDNMKIQTPGRQQSLENPKRSSIKSPRTSLPLSSESMKPIDEVETTMSSLKIEEITESAAGTEIPGEEPLGFLFKANGDKPEKVLEQTINEVVEKEELIRYEMVNISRGDFDKMELESRARKVIRIDHKTLPPDIDGASGVLAEESGTHEEWKDVPIPVIDEIHRLTKPKRPHKCLKACPCKFTQEFIDIYHESKLLSARAKEISEAREHCTLRMTSSEIDFFKKDTTMCNVMIGEIRSRRAEMRELMDMWQEANEKLKGRKKEIVSIVESIEQTGKRIDEVENLLKDWLPEGRMEKLRKSQRAIEKEDREKLEALEDEERTFAKERIEEIVQKREAWQEEERSREEKRKNQRQQDMKTLQNATTLMQKYIDERKSLLVQ